MAAFTAAVCGSGVALMQLGLDTADDPQSGMRESDIHLFHDLFTGVLLVMGIAIVLIAVSAVINQVADIHDRADTFSDLFAAGVDPQLIHRALVRAVMAPAIWVSLLAGGLGLLLVLPLAGAVLRIQTGHVPHDPADRRRRHRHHPCRTAADEADPALRGHGRAGSGTQKSAPSPRRLAGSRWAASVRVSVGAGGHADHVRAGTYDGRCPVAAVAGYSWSAPHGVGEDEAVRKRNTIRATTRAMTV